MHVLPKQANCIVEIQVDNADMFRQQICHDSHNSAGVTAIYLAT
jgi:hypothetical protein